MIPARLPRAAGAPWPLEPSAQGIARLAQNILGQPYGWGGLFGWRDCSATTRDLLAPFGLWLPRNSGDQAQAGTRFVSLEGLTPAQKEERIQALGLPWLSLLWMPGHIMLYVGAPQGRYLVLHSVWGVKTWHPRFRRGPGPDRPHGYHQLGAGQRPAREGRVLDRAGAGAGFAGATGMVGGGAGVAIRLFVYRERRNTIHKLV